MNHEQWTQLLEATKGHTPGPRLMWEGWCVRQDMILAAAAPDLLAEVERLRGWMSFFQRESPTARLVLCADAALDGVEVPE